MPLHAHSQLGRYELIREVARSNDVVFEAWDPKVQRRVAIKALNLPAGITGTQERDRMMRFDREARAAARLHHPNIVTLFDFGTDGDQPFLVFEFINAPTLAQILEDRGALPPAKAIAYARQLLAALGFAHSQGVIHRDIKPSNIFVSGSDHLKITDLGIARIESEESVTNDGQIFGTPAYMSPEQVKGQLIDRRTDIWAAGAVLYQMVTGVQAFCGGSVLEIGSSVLTKDPDLSLIAEPSLREVIARALAKDMDSRFANAEQMDTALLIALQMVNGHNAAQAPTPQYTTVNTPAQPTTQMAVVNPRKARSRAAVAAVWAMALVMGTGGAIAIHYWPSSIPRPAQAAPVLPSRLTPSAILDQAWDRYSLHEMAKSGDYKFLSDAGQLDQLDTWFRTNMSTHYLALSQEERDDLLKRLKFRLSLQPDIYNEAQVQLNPPSQSSASVEPTPPVAMPAQGSMPGPYSGRDESLVLPPTPAQIPSATPHPNRLAYSFDIGSPESDVVLAHGKADAVEYTPGKTRYFYGNSIVVIQNGIVTSYANHGELRVSHHANAPSTAEPRNPAAINHGPRTESYDGPRQPATSAQPPRRAAEIPLESQDPPPGTHIYHAVDLNDEQILRQLHFRATKVEVKDGIRKYSGPDGVVYIR